MTPSKEIHIVLYNTFWVDPNHWHFAPITVVPEVAFGTFWLRPSTAEWPHSCYPHSRVFCM